MATSSEKITSNYKIEDFQDYISFISEVGNMFSKDLVLYRGQGCDKPLIPKLGRLEVDDIKAFEQAIYKDFQKRYLAYSQKVYSNSYDILALAQHYGMPSRLLDWTENALIALWFATEYDTNEAHGVVWLLAPDEDDILDEKDSDPFSVRSTKIFCPNHISERITAQSGWFTCHKLMSDNKFLQFQKLKKHKDKLFKIIIPSSLFSEIRVKLSLMGVNSVNVYPDLVGLARHLTWKHLKTESFYVDK